MPKQTAAQRQAAYAKWKKAFDKPKNREFTAGFTYAHANRLSYLGTIVGLKADPLGRFPLMDVYSEGETVYLMLSGASVGKGNPVLLAAVFVDSGAYYTVANARRYMRQHALPGARIEGQGWGAAAYIASAWMVRRLSEGAPPVVGTTSPVPKRDSDRRERSEEASALWDSLVDRGIAVRYPMAEGGPLWDFLRYERLWDTGLLVWSEKQKGASLKMHWSWNGKERTGVNKVSVAATRAADREFFHGGKLKKTTAERLARAYHGDSELLIFTVAQKLLDDGYGKLAKQYLQRVDVMAVASKSPKYKRFMSKLPKGSAPALFGLGAEAAAQEAAESGKIHVDWSEENPLHLPALSAEAQREVDEFPSF